MKKQILTGRRVLAAATMVAALAAGGLTATAQDDIRPEDGPAVALAADDDDFAFGPGGGRFGGRMARQLDLSDAQRDAIAKIHQAGRERDLPLRKQARLLRHELQGEMMKDAPSEKAVLALAAKISDVRAQLQAGRLKDRLAVRAQLTDEQRDRMLAAGGPRGGRHGMRGGMRGDCDGSGPEGRDRGGRGPVRGRPGDGQRGPRWQQDAD